MAGDSDAELIQADGDLVTLGRAGKRLILAANEDENDKCRFKLGARIKSGELKNIKFEFGLEHVEIDIRIGARGRTVASISEKDVSTIDLDIKTFKTFIITKKSPNAVYQT